MLMRHFGIDADHFRVIQRLDKSQHRARCGQVDVAARFVGFGFQGEFETATISSAVALVNDVLGEEIHRLTEPFTGVQRIFTRIRFRAFPPAPENINLGSQLHA